MLMKMCVQQVFMIGMLQDQTIWNICVWLHLQLSMKYLHQKQHKTSEYSGDAEKDVDDIHGPDDNDGMYLAENENSENVPNVCGDEDNN